MDIVSGGTVVLELLKPVAPRPETRVVLRPPLTTSVPTLDRILGGFDPGKVTLIDSGSTFVFGLTSLLCVRSVLEDRPVVFVDGGNSIDPHGIVAIARRVGLARLDVLPRIHVARAFTCHQMATLVLDMLDPQVEATEAGLVVLSCLPEMFLDEDVPRGEAHQLFLRSMRRIREVTGKRNVVTLVTNAGPAKLYRRKSIRRVLYGGVDRAVRFLQQGSNVLITLPELGVSETYRPVPPSQATLDDYGHEAPRIADLSIPGQPTEVRDGGYLRIGW